MSDDKATFTGKKPRELNEETIELVRRRIGIPISFSPRQHNEYSSVDSFRHFALGCGDDNPLYTDRDYAEASPWGAPIAPPLYAYSAGIRRPFELSDAEKAELKGGDPLAGIGQYMCGERWIFPRPIREGNVLWLTQSLFSAELKQSTFGAGSGALVSHRVSWEDEGGSPFAYRFLDYWHADREKSAKAGTNKQLEQASFTEDDVERIEACYAAETVRGATPRYVDEVQVGEELGPIVKGPLLGTEILAWHTGTGWGFFGGGASRIAYKNRQRVPKFYTLNEFGFPDTAQRCHWEDEWAQRMGHLAAYDYGIMRSTWMGNLVTNWMGDGAWLWKFSTSIRKFNYRGDVHFLSGVVREVDRATNAVTIDLWGENQRGTRSCEARAVVILPPPGGGTAEIPPFDPEDVPEAQAP
jgi:acyl dehydratase